MLGGTFADDLLKLIFHGTPIPNVAANAIASPLSSLYASLHTANPGVAGSQSANELNYSGYARVAVGRNSISWIVDSGVARPSGRISFGAMTDGLEVSAGWFAIGTAASGAGKILVRGRITPEIECRVGVEPALKSDTRIVFVNGA